MGKGTYKVGSLSLNLLVSLFTPLSTGLLCPASLKTYQAQADVV